MNTGKLCKLNLLYFFTQSTVLVILANTWTCFNFIIFLPENKLNEALENRRPKGGGQEPEYRVSFYYKIWADWPYN